MGAYGSPEEAYWAFFERFTAKDAAGWAACMSYPHVRVSPPREGSTARTASRFYETPEDYAAAADWAPFEAAGWVRTQGIEPTRLHDSEDMVHLLGGWTRFNAADEPIRENRVAYILTRLESGWGIQARFGIDTWDEQADVSRYAKAGEDVARGAIAAGSIPNFELHADFCHFPLTVVAPGQVMQIPTREELIEFESARVTGERIEIESDVRAVQAGRTSVNVAITMQVAGRTTQELVLVTLRDRKWGITAASAMAG